MKLGSATRDYLGSFAARFVAAEEALTGKHQGKADPKELAARLDVFQPCIEPVQVSLRPKNGTLCDYRVILSFGPENSARQILVRNGLRARWAVAYEQTMFAKPGGTKEAIRRVCEAYAEGDRWTAELDVKKCYNGFSTVGVARYLCLPEEVVRHTLSAESLASCVLSSRTMRAYVHHLPSDPISPWDLSLEQFGEEWSAAQQGLIEGSRASPFVLELLLAEVLPPRAAGRVINFADNFFLMARTKDDLARLSTELRDALRAHPAGLLSVKTSEPVPPGQDFEFLGYRITPVNDALAVTWSDGHENDARLMRRKAYSFIHSKKSFEQKARYLAQVERRHRQKVNGFSSWQEGRAFHAAKFAKLTAALDRQAPQDAGE